MHQDVLGSCTSEQAGQKEKVLKNHHFGERGQTPCEASRRSAVACVAATVSKKKNYWIIMNGYKVIIDTTSKYMEN